MGLGKQAVKMDTLILVTVMDPFCFDVKFNWFSRVLVVTSTLPTAAARLISSSLSHSPHLRLAHLKSRQNGPLQST